MFTDGTPEPLCRISRILWRFEEKKRLLRLVEPAIFGSQGFSFEGFSPDKPAIFGSHSFSFERFSPKSCNFWQ